MMPKGRDAERAVKERYESAGYEVYHPPHAKYREQDVFGVFDLLAFGHDHLEAVQVKGGRDAAGIKQWFEQAGVYEAHIDGLRLAFVHVTDEGWRLARSTADGYQWVYDGRSRGGSHADDLEVWLVE